jgi:4-hydroxybenzoate polyprenyltransferase
LIALLGIFSILYSVPITFKGKKYFIRNIPFLKTFIVAATWTIVVAYIPMVLISIPIEGSIGWIVSEFFFLLSLSILFDLKDIEKDKLLEIKTIPIALGFNNTKMLSIGLMAIRLVPLYLTNALFTHEWIISFIAISCILFLLTKKRGELFYMLTLDGIMLIKLFLFINTIV